MSNYKFIKVFFITISTVLLLVSSQVSNLNFVAGVEDIDINPIIVAGDEDLDINPIIVAGDEDIDINPIIVAGDEDLDINPI